MNEKMFNTRIIHKHDSEANWNKAVNFIPIQGEIIVYDIDENYNYERVKIGDGVRKVSSLPFIGILDATLSVEGSAADAKAVGDALAEKQNTISVLPVENGGTGYNSIQDTTYTTARYRASSLHSAETTPSTNGVICWVYE